jgi:hypothetical protein
MLADGSGRKVRSRCRLGHRTDAGRSALVEFKQGFLGREAAAEGRERERQEGEQTLPAG